MKKNLINLFIGISLFSTFQLFAQQNQDPTGLNQEIEYRINALGDADMTLKMKMNAMQWQAFKASPAASNPTIFKRDMEREMSGYLLEDLKTDLNENDRSSVTSLKVRCMAEYRGNNKWEVKMDMKDPSVTKLSENGFLLTGNMVSGGGLIHQIQKIFLPEEATEISQDTDSFGNAVIKYELDVESSGPGLMTIGGIALMLAGGGMFVAVGRKK